MGKRRRESDEVARWAGLLAAGEGDAAGAAAWIAAGGTDPDLPGQWPEPLQVAVVERAADTADPTLLAALAAAGLSKRGAKALRRARHRLRNRGIEVPEPQGAGTVERGREREPSSLLTDVDATGSRILLLVRSADEGVDVAEAREHVLDGLVALRQSELSRREYREQVERGLTARGVPHIEIDYASARDLLVRARERARAAGRADAAQAYGEAMIRFPRGGGSPRPGARAQLGAPDLAADRPALREAVRLHELDEFRTWAIAPEALDRLFLKLQEVEQSPLYINEAQKVEQRAAMIRRAAEESFDEPVRELHAARLEAMADYLLWSDREAEAWLALVAATHLADRSQDVIENPFVMSMVDKLLPKVGAAAGEPGLVAAPPGVEAADATPDGEDEDQGGGGLIVLP